MKGRNDMEECVQSTRVNFYQDQSYDTEIKLDNGEFVLFSGIAPVPKGNKIRAEGTSKSYFEILREIHPKVPIEKLENRVAEHTEETFHATSILDTTSDINYSTL